MGLRSGAFDAQEIRHALVDVNLPPSPIKFFPSFEKIIYSKMLKLSVAVHSSLGDTLIGKLCAHDFWRCHGSHKLHVRLKKSQLLTLFSTFFHSGLILY